MSRGAILRPFAAVALLLFLAAAASLASCAAAKEGQPFAMVGVDEVERMMREPDVAVIDANPRDMFDEHHLPGARHYKSAPFAEVLPPDKGKRLVFYCASPS